jgi:hypothetical protein
MTVATQQVQVGTPWEAVPEGRPEITTLAPETAPESPGPLTAEELVALALAGGAEDPDIAADTVFAAAGGRRDRLSAAASLLIQRLTLRSDDLEASLALRIVERALVRAPYADGPWRWAQNISPRRQRSADRRRRRAVQRRRTGPPMPNRAAWRSWRPWPRARR